jgi:hypothetical protein
MENISKVIKIKWESSGDIDFGAFPDLNIS